MILKKAGLLCVLFSLVVLASGCETAKGFAQDTKNTWQQMKKADAWMTKNLW